MPSPVNIERCCSNCGSPLDFSTLMLSLHPYAISCKGCEEKIRPDTTLVTIFALILFALLWVIWNVLSELGIHFQTNLMVIVGIILGGEYLLYEALRQGWLASNLVFLGESDAHPAFSGTPLDPSSTTSTEISGGILPQIKTLRDIETLQTQLADKPEQLPITESLFGDLMLTYLLKLDEQRECLSPSLIKQYGLERVLSPESLRSIAEANAQPILSTLLQSVDGKVTRLTCNDHLMATGLLFSTLWDQIEQQVGTEVVIAVPHRDHIWYVPANDASAVQQLRNAVANADFDDAHRLSQLLFVREEGEWEVFDD